MMAVGGFLRATAERGDQRPSVSIASPVCRRAGHRWSRLQGPARRRRRGDRLRPVAFGPRPRLCGRGGGGPARGGHRPWTVQGESRHHGRQHRLPADPPGRRLPPTGTDDELHYFEAVLEGGLPRLRRGPPDRRPPLDGALELGHPVERPPGVGRPLSGFGQGAGDLIVGRRPGPGVMRPSQSARSWARVRSTVMVKGARDDPRPGPQVVGHRAGLDIPDGPAPCRASSTPRPSRRARGPAARPKSTRKAAPGASTRRARPRWPPVGHQMQEMAGQDGAEVARSEGQGGHVGHGQGHLVDGPRHCPPVVGASGGRCRQPSQRHAGPGQGQGDASGAHTDLEHGARGPSSSASMAVSRRWTSGGRPRVAS